MDVYAAGRRASGNFSDLKPAFVNVNTTEDLQALQEKK